MRQFERKIRVAASCLFSTAYSPRFDRSNAGRTTPFLQVVESETAGGEISQQ